MVSNSQGGEGEFRLIAVGKPGQKQQCVQGMEAERKTACSQAYSSSDCLSIRYVGSMGLGSGRSLDWWLGIDHSSENSLCRDTMLHRELQG